MANSQKLRLRFADPGARLPGEFMRISGRFPVQLESFEDGEWTVVPMVMEGIATPPVVPSIPRFEVSHD